jgi:transposase
MQLKTILNRVERYKSFVFGKIVWASSGLQLEVEIKCRANSKGICSNCCKPAATYDHAAQTRSFEFVPLWGIAVFFLYRMRRVNCQSCGIKVEVVPWADGKHQLTRTYTHFLATWARRLAWKEVAEIFCTSWSTVYRAVKAIVDWGLAHRSLQGITAIGVDEIQWRRGHRYLTLVYQIDQGVKRLLWIAKDRTAEALTGFFDLLGEQRSRAIHFVCSDMWRPYLDVIASKANAALHILDRFHIMQRFNKAIDEVRAAEVKRLKRDGYEPVLKHSRWCLLKRPENLTEKQTVRLRELLQYNLKSVRAYLLREYFQRFWKYRSVGWARRFFAEWSAQAMRSRIPPVKKFVRTIRKHQKLIFNWFEAKGRISAGVVEGLNNKVKLTMRKSYGFRSQEVAQVALFHSLGKLPEPAPTHRFC